MNGRLFRLVPLLATCVLASCIWLGDEEEMDEDAGCLTAGGGGATPEPSLDSETAAVAGSAIRFTASRLAWAYEPPSLGWTSAGCVTVTGADADADGFPDAATAGNVALDSCQRPAFGGLLGLSGSATVEDTDGGALASFAHEATGSFAVTGSGFDAATWTFSDAGGDATGYYGLYSSASVALVTATPDFVDLTLERYRLDAAYDPAGTWTPGTVLSSGTLTVDGPWLAVFPEVVANGQLQTAVPLTVDPGCAERVTAGELRAYYATFTTDDECSGPNWAVFELSVTWTGCGSVTVQHSFDHNTSEDPYP